MVEIQHVKEGHFYDRFLYYHLINLVEQVKNSKAYQFDRTVYTIVVLTSPYSESEIDFSVAITDFNPVNEFRRKVDVYPHQLVFVVPRMVNEQTPPGIKAWLELVLDSLDGEMDENSYNSPIFERVIDAVKRDNISPAERRVLKDEESWEDTLIDTRQKEKETIARALISEGISTAVITRTTGLTETEIEKLRQP